MQTQPWTASLWAELGLTVSSFTCSPVDVDGHASLSALDNPRGIFSFKGAPDWQCPQVSGRGKYSLASETPCKYSSKEYDVKITITQKEKKQLRQSSQIRLRCQDINENYFLCLEK